MSAWNNASSRGAAHLHNKSISTMPPVSIVRGRCSCSSCSTLSMDFPMPPATFVIQRDVIVPRVAW